MKSNLEQERDTLEHWRKRAIKAETEVERLEKYERDYHGLQRCECSDDEACALLTRAEAAEAQLAAVREWANKPTWSYGTDRSSYGVKSAKQHVLSLLAATQGGEDE